MRRYFNKKTQSEAIEGFHKIDADCVELPENHPFWQPLPHGHVVEFDDSGLPVIRLAQLNDEQKSFSEIKWRNAEIDSVARQLDQIRNDLAYGSDTYKGAHSAEQLNAYRVALCDYPSQDGFPNVERPALQ